MNSISSFLSVARWTVGFMGIIAIGLFSGCSSFVTENPYFTVKDSGLNWIEIRQYEMTGSNRRVHVRIDGNGLVQVREGSSQQVSNPFAKQYDSDQWNDVRNSRIMINPADASQIFQRLVDAGLFVKDTPEQKAADLSKQALFVSANIQAKMTSSPEAVASPRLLEQLKLTVLMFYHPQPSRRK